ncbi:ABC transporter permease [Parenemella sanctibonifatiensis]|uniref:Oligopeptide transport system permease protein OppC n=1 Tax=Parenemella sanctibonifatiensis TaxID=2016505 RepID=A0A255EQQ6_9ACTN|nr:ABC transporter permease [Parenemella sanctibonifatiensis]OYN90453.1 peptide ABC transporter permease [Parenemella sanctibonifatiensis]
MSSDQIETQTVETATPTTRKRLSRSQLYVKRFFRNKMAVIGLAVFFLLILLSIFGKVISPYDFSELDFMAFNQPPNSQHWFGTNALGQDNFTRTAHGLQRSIIIAVCVSSATTLISAMVGATAAYFGGAYERIVLAIIHFLLVVPTFLILAMLSNSAGGDWRVLIVVMIAIGWMYAARVIWSLSMSIREREYVTASRYMGVNPFVVVWRHMVPNIGSLLVIQFTLGIVGTVMSETGLSFLGFGIKLPDVSLGTLLQEGNATLTTTPWLFYFPAGVLTLLTTSMALIADGLRDALDPSSAAGGQA